MNKSNEFKYLWYILQLSIFDYVLFMSKMYLELAIFSATTIAILITMHGCKSNFCNAIFFMIELCYTVLSTVYVVFVFLFFEGKFQTYLLIKIILCCPIVVNYVIIAKESASFFGYGIKKPKEICLGITSIIHYENNVKLLMEKNEYGLSEINLSFIREDFTSFRIPNHIVIIEIVIAIILFHQDIHITVLLVALLMMSMALCFMFRIKKTRKLSSAIAFFICSTALFMGFIAFFSQINTCSDRNIEGLAFLICVSPINFYVTSANLVSSVLNCDINTMACGSALLCIKECDLQIVRFFVGCELCYIIEKDNEDKILLITNGYEKFSIEIKNGSVKQ